MAGCWNFRERGFRIEEQSSWIEDCDPHDLSQFFVIRFEEDVLNRSDDGGSRFRQVFSAGSSV